MKSKTKIMSIAAASLACVAVAGVGFASWVITNTQSANIEGSINVETVDDNRVELVAVVTEGEISFTHDKLDSHTYKWLSYDQEAKKEDLTATITLTITGYNNATAINVKLTDEGNKFAEAVSDKYVIYPTLTTDKGSKVISATDTDIKEILKDGENTITVTFGWGDTFKPEDGSAGVNPAVYYDQEYTKELADQAKTQLEDLNTTLSGVAYVITFTPTNT